MTHRDGLSDLSARSARRSDVGHRKARATPSERSESPPLRSLLERFGGRQQALEMPHIAGGLLPTRSEPKAIPMSHYHQDLVLAPAPAGASPSRFGTG